MLIFSYLDCNILNSFDPDYMHDTFFFSHFTPTDSILFTLLKILRLQSLVTRSEIPLVTKNCFVSTYIFLIVWVRVWSNDMVAKVASPNRPTPPKIEVPLGNIVWYWNCYRSKRDSNPMYITCSALNRWLLQVDIWWP